MKLLLFAIGIFMISCNANDYQSSRDIPKEATEKKNAETSHKLQDGDLIFHTSQSDQSEAIQIATNSKYSHMGIIYQDGNEYFVYEAIQPVRLTRLQDWIDRGKDGKYVVKRLKNRDELLTEEGIRKMKAIGIKYLGKDYDLRFEWSDNKIYCSELVWKIYKEAFNIEIGTLEKFNDFDLSNQTVQKKVKERYGNKIPKDELVITPDRMFESNKLITVIEH